MYGKMRRLTISDLLVTDQALSNEDDKFAVGVWKLDKLIFAEKRRIL